MGIPIDSVVCRGTVKKGQKYTTIDFNVWMRYRENIPAKLVGILLARFLSKIKRVEYLTYYDMDQTSSKSAFIYTNIEIVK